MLRTVIDGVEYDDFPDLADEQTATDRVCGFTIEPAEELSLEASASRLVPESSNETWAALHVRQSIGTSTEGVTLERYAEDHAELGTALEKWGGETPR